MSLATEIQRALESALPDSKIHVTDPMNDQTHLEAVVVSSAFTEKSLVQQHMMVMKPLNDHFKGVLHALSLKTYTPEQWNQKQKEKS